MGKYSVKLVNDYIDGKEIENIDDLEDDPIFMMQAINVSGDYKLYNLCSDNVKKDFDFVRFLIIKFRNNVDFIFNVANYYIETHDDFEKDELNITEIIAILINIPMDKEKSIYTRMKGHSLYYHKRIQIESCKRNDEELSKELGMGFLLIYEEFMERTIVLEFYAKKIIDGIFEEYGICLDQLLHDKFKEANDIDKYGVNNFLLSFINNYDSALAAYLSVNLYLLDDIKKDIKMIQKKWNSYVNLSILEKYNQLFDKVHEYVSSEGDDMIIDETAAIYYIGKKLGIIEDIHKYDLIYCNEDIEEILDEQDEELIKEMLDCSFRDRVHLSNIKKIMKEVIFSQPKSNDYKKKKILRVDFKNKNNNKK